MRDKGDAPAQHLVGPLACNVLALELDLAFAQGQHTGNRLHQRGLARAVGADDAMHLALLNGHMGVIQNGRAIAISRGHTFDG